MAAKSSQTPQNKAAAKAELKRLRQQQKQEKIDAKARKKDKKNKEDGFFSRIKQVFSMTREYDPNIGWWMALAGLLAGAAMFVVFTLLLNWITGIIMALPTALLGSLIVMNRKGQAAGFARIEGRPGASAAALNTLRRGWIVTEEPVSMDPRTHDAIFRVVGKPGVVLVTEGPAGRVRKMLGKTRKRFSPILKDTGVPLHVIETGRGEGQVPLPKLTKELKKLEKRLNKHEVHELEKRLTALPISRPPVPKGVDPYRARPDRKALRGG